MDESLKFLANHHWHIELPDLQRLTSYAFKIFKISQNISANSIFIYFSIYVDNFTIIVMAGKISCTLVSFIIHVSFIILLKLVD